MTISRTVYNQLFEHSSTSSPSSEHVIRLRPTEAKAGAVVVSAKNKIQMWTQEEHERFLAALEMFPTGPWKNVSDYIGTKTPRQTMTHAQKYRQKISRRQRGLRNRKKAAPSDPLIGMQSEFSSHMLHSVQSPYGVADMCVKSESGQSYHPMHGVTAATAADPSIDRLDILARAMQMQSDVKPNTFAYTSAVQPQSMEMMSLHETSRSVHASLPSLAQILNLRGSASPQLAQPGCNYSCSPSVKLEPRHHPSSSRQ